MDTDGSPGEGQGAYLASDDNPGSPSSRVYGGSCLRRCGARCFTCSKGCSELTADVFKRISPKSAVGAKQCAACSVFLLLVAIALIVQALVIPTVLHKDLVVGLKKAVILDDPTSDEFIKWQDNTANPLTLTTYVYHVENPVELLLGATPKLKEMGPYVYYVSATDGKDKCMQATSTCIRWPTAVTRRGRHMCSLSLRA